MKRAYHLWTVAEDTILRAIFASHETIADQLHLLPGHNLQSLKNRARSLGLKKAVRVVETSKPVIVAAMAYYGVRSAPDLAKLTKIHIVTVRKIINEMVKAGEAHIDGYAPATLNGMPTRLFKLGPGRNAPQPRTKTPSERVKAWEKRQDPEELKVRRSRYATRRKIKLGKLIPERDPLAAAFFGGV
ncbi:hypothetical protein [Pandoraea apista]|uniref:Uncharacterized protein n=1 Tax=Pandoraea apista TaxID=93218 RepID=A0ABX9ZHH7_9BURK|nr:hypothetical protein [Pandoraea apista]PTE02691.1 hypothetical protein C7830_00250 [Pandoraea apista]RRJ27560.1 hypothetical protein EIB05_21625 [Pandoraea apista]RRJ73149.1 hypothetical protein EIL82_21940 [Pandoraea apista]RSD06460.1 hypothetical protein EJB12_21530 [Pandoraea apista]RSD11297.1 hypothetical protein EIZ52_21615 [Pandoraea apista]